MAVNSKKATILSENLKFTRQKMDDDENQFIIDDIVKVLQETVDSILTDCFFEKEKINMWCIKVSEMCVNALSKMKKPFKYIVNCMIMQKTGAGLHTCGAYHWNSGADGMCTLRWENKTMYCIVTVFGLGI